MKDTSHLGGSGPNGDPWTFMPDVWGYLCYKYNLRSVLDIGCALGFNARWLLDHGFNAIGVEGFPDYVKDSKLPPERITLHDFTEGPWEPPMIYDLGICTEFVEHVEEQYVPNFVATFKFCRFLLMTHALPGQGGHHHVNEKPSEYWTEIMAKAGFDHLAAETALLRSTGGPVPYGRNTLMLFVNIRL